MKSSMRVLLKRFYLLTLIATMVLGSILVMAQGRTLTRANRFDHGGLKPGDYLKIDELKAFEGIWQWVSAESDSVFTLKLWREKLELPSDWRTHAFSYDVLAGHYTLTVNGIIASTNTNKRTENNFPTFRVTDFNHDGIDVLEGSFQDFVKNKWSRGRFELFRDNTNMARWSMWDEGFIILSPGEVFHRGFSLPNNIVLNRVQVSPPPLP